MTNKEFVNYEIALALKELGFDESCLRFWYSTPFDKPYLVKPGDLGCDQQGYIRAPLFQQTFRWFREKHGLLGVLCNINNPNTGWSFDINKLTGGILFLWDVTMTPYKTYEEAQVACLEELIRIVEEL